MINKTHITIIILTLLSFNTSFAQTATIYLTTSGGSFSSEKWTNITTGINGTGTVIWQQGGGTIGTGAGLLTDEAITLNCATTFYLNTFDRYDDGWDGTIYEIRDAAAGSGTLIINNSGSSPDDGTDADGTSTWGIGEYTVDLESSESFTIPCPTANCSDGIQNQGETGIDCGGPCLPCGTAIIPTACATQTFNITANSTFYDDGGAGGQPCTDGHPNNFANSNCETTTTICAPVGQTILVNFNKFSMYNTSSAYDWMKIYEGAGTGGSKLFDNDTGGADHAPDGGSGSGFGDCGDDAPPTGLCSNSSNCMTFEFHASGVINREGWDASILLANSTNCALPITLLSFDGESLAEYNQLKWSTSSEINNAYFVLEKSEDAINFEISNSQNGAGNSNSILNYTDIDIPTTETTYYRLKQVDFDGNFSYSDIISISNSLGEFNIYPNPSKGGYIYIDKLNGTEKISLTDTQGRLIEQFLANDNSSLRINLNNYIRGMYYLVITTKNSIVTEKIIIQ